MIGSRESSTGTVSNDCIKDFLHGFIIYFHFDEEVLDEHLTLLFAENVTHTNSSRFHEELPEALLLPEFPENKNFSDLKVNKNPDDAFTEVSNLPQFPENKSPSELKTHERYGVTVTSDVTKQKTFWNQCSTLFGSKPKSINNTDNQIRRACECNIS